MEDLYPVGIVGESHYQRAISQTCEGDSVWILRELNNPYSKTGTALRVDNLKGETIGYIAEDHWLRDAIIHEKKGCRARVLRIEGEPMGVVLEIQLGGESVSAIEYGKKSIPLKAGVSSIASMAKSFWKRLS